MTSKHLTWLHISDIHVKAEVSYDRDIVLGSLVKSMAAFKSRQFTPNLIFFTGDVAFSGKPGEYKEATLFFNALLHEVGLSKDCLFIIPGNHDVDRSRHKRGLTRTLNSQDEANYYFGEEGSLLHIDICQRAFAEWHNDFFQGVRNFNSETTCGPCTIRDFNGFRIGILPINTAAFCCGDDDNGKLWIGRSCLDRSLTDELEQADLRVALMHHPLDWLHENERTQIRSSLYGGLDIILRGHLHQLEAEKVDGTSGAVVHLAAGASYQGSAYPNKASFVEVFDGYVRVIPIRYDDLPSPRWSLDTSMFPKAIDYLGILPWQDSRVGAQTPMPDDGLPKNVLVDPVTEHHLKPNKTESLVEKALKALDSDLFVGNSGRSVYVEPRLSKVSQNAVTLENEDIPFTAVQEVVQDKGSYIVSVPSEYGGTALSRKLLLEFARTGVQVELQDALALPNYRARLRSVFSSHGAHGGNQVLILDNYNRTLMRSL